MACGKKPEAAPRDEIDCRLIRAIRRALLGGTGIGGMTLGDLARRLGCELIGDGAIEITGVGGMEQAGHHELTFLRIPSTRACPFVSPCVLPLGIV